MTPLWARRLISYIQKYRGIDLVSHDIPTFPKGFYIGEGKTKVKVTSEMFATVLPEPEPKLEPKQKQKQKEKVKPEPEPKLEDDDDLDDVPFDN